VDRTLEIAQRVIPAYRGLGGLSFAYGHGSVVAGYTTTSALDLVIVWDRDEAPRLRGRPVRELNDAQRRPTSFDYQPGFVLDRFWVDGQRVEVAHRTRKTFEGWVADVRQGWGWEEAAFPMPLYAVAGFAYGTLLADSGNVAGAIRDKLTAFPEELVSRSLTMLAAELTSYDHDLGDCASRGDGLLFHELLSKVLRHTLVAWFASEGRYCPNPKWLHRWVARFAMSPAIAGLERSLWGPITLARRRELFLTMARQVLALKPAGEPSRPR
jgi:hypothetical protein